MGSADLQKRWAILRAPHLGLVTEFEKARVLVLLMAQSWAAGLDLYVYGLCPYGPHRYGAELGCRLRPAVLTLGLMVGLFVEYVSAVEGNNEGIAVGVSLGIREGVSVGSRDGASVGNTEGACDGAKVGVNVAEPQIRESRDVKSPMNMRTRKRTPMCACVHTHMHRHKQRIHVLLPVWPVNLHKSLCMRAYACMQLAHSRSRRREHNEQGKQTSVP